MILFCTISVVVLCLDRQSQESEATIDYFRTSDCTADDDPKIPNIVHPIKKETDHGEEGGDVRQRRK
jgi:hypothetical protein